MINKSKISILIKCSVMAVSLLSCFLIVHGQEVNYKSQSLYIYQFIKYIQWPDNLNDRDFLIGIYGNSPIYEELNTMASIVKTPAGKDIKVIRINSIEEIQNIQLLYVTSAKSREITLIANKVMHQPTLTVAERDGLARKGAIINFIIMENNLLKFEINKTELERHQLQISPELLKIGYIVG